MEFDSKEFDLAITGYFSSRFTVYFNADDNDPVVGHLRNGAMWGLELLQITKLFADRHSVILDIGAHIGTYGMLCALFTTNRVISIEASPVNFQCLERNKSFNRLVHWEIHNIAADSKNGTLRFTESGPGGHIAIPSDANPIEVPSIKLDDLLEKESQIDFIKLDIEGYEIEALYGLEKILTKFNPPILFEVNGHTLKFFDKTPNDLLKVLEEKFGYKIFVCANRLIPIKNTDIFPFGVIDCLAVKEKDFVKITNMVNPSLTDDQTQEILKATYLNGNDDIKKYVDYYRKKMNIQ